MVNEIVARMVNNKHYCSSTFTPEAIRINFHFSRGEGSDGSY